MIGDQTFVTNANVAIFRFGGLSCVFTDLTIFSVPPSIKNRKGAEANYLITPGTGTRTIILGNSSLIIVIVNFCRNSADSKAQLFKESIFLRVLPDVEPMVRSNFLCSL